MKKIVRNNRIVVLAFFTVFTVVASLTARASGEYELPVQLKYAGVVNNQPVYKLIVSGTQGADDYTVVIRDENQNAIYRENIKGESFTKSFVLNTAELGDEKLQFEVYSRNNRKTVTFEVARVTQIEEKVVVTAVK